MANCDYVPFCPFFNNLMENMPVVSDMLKQQYCLTDFAGCARYKVMKAKGAGNVPGDLFPNDVSRALVLVNG